MDIGKLGVSIAAVFITIALYVIHVGYQKRSRVHRLRKAGLAMPPNWSWLTGHLMVLKQYLDCLPPDANVFMAMKEFALQHADTEVFLLDLWPVFDQVLMVYGPEAATQVSTKLNLPKPASQHHSLLPIVGGPSIISMNGEEWKLWRSIFDPGFSMANLQNMVPAIVDAVTLFCEILETRVDQPMFCLDDFTTRLTMDIITKATLDIDLKNQKTEHPYAHALKMILDWHSFWDPRVLLNPLRPFVQRYYGKVMRNFIEKEIESRYQDIVMVKTNEKESHPKSVVELALEEHLRHQKQGQEVKKTTLDPNFMRLAANQIRLFLFAGNDTTSSSILYTYHLLSKNTEALLQLQKEHNSVFGAVSTTAERLKHNPALLNLCPYILAVIKETLRLYPPSSTLRQGKAGVSITDHLGNVYPTDGLGVTIMHNYVHENPRVWVRPTEFLPERWLVQPGHELYPPPNSGVFRPFEHGPRNCIGQSLVYIEMRIVLIMTMRKFSIEPAYEEWDALKERNENVISKIARYVGLKSKGVNTVYGDRAYQTSRGGAHPADGYPCRVTKVKSQSTS